MEASPRNADSRTGRPIPLHRGLGMTRRTCVSGGTRTASVPPISPVHDTWNIATLGHKTQVSKRRDGSRKLPLRSGASVVAPRQHTVRGRVRGRDLCFMRVVRRPPRPNVEGRMQPSGTPVGLRSRSRRGHSRRGSSRDDRRMDAAGAARAAATASRRGGLGLSGRGDAGRRADGFGMPRAARLRARRLAGRRPTGPAGRGRLARDDPAPGWLARPLGDPADSRLDHPVRPVALEGPGDPRAGVPRAARWLLGIKGRATPRSDDPEHIVGHDTTLVGWPWVADTHSWLEPTALAVLALGRAGLGEHPRVVEGLRLIRDRAVDTGGWNCGNKATFGRALRPQPAPTGLALLTLAQTPGEPRSPLVDRAIRYLTATLPGVRAAWSLGWGLLGLRAWSGARGGRSLAVRSLPARPRPPRRRAEARPPAAGRRGRRRWNSSARGERRGAVPISRGAQRWITPGI